VDAFFMIQQAIASDDPVIFFEPKRRYWTKAEVDVDATPRPLHRAQVVRPGRDVTVVAYGPMVATALDAATAAAEEGRELEVIDLRSLSPLDTPTVVESVRRTGRLVLVHEASVTLGLGAEIAARVQERRSTRWSRRCSESAASTPRTRPAGWKRCGCLTSTASSTRLTARSPTEQRSSGAQSQAVQAPRRR
jgi:pyruvate/2-oxoglutarate/acetoin dehydrogenase E1 component